MEILICFLSLVCCVFLLSAILVLIRSKQKNDKRNENVDRIEYFQEKQSKLENLNGPSTISKGVKIPSLMPVVKNNEVKPLSVNYHFTRQCNYKCGFCFHTAKTSFVLPLEDAKRGLKMLKDSGNAINPAFPSFPSLYGFAVGGTLNFPLSFGESIINLRVMYACMHLNLLL